MTPKKTNLKSTKKTKEDKNKESKKIRKLLIKNYDDKKIFSEEKIDFLKKKKGRSKPKTDNKSLPTSIKNLITDYGEVMASVGAKDLSKYDEFKKYSKNKKTKK